MKVKRSFLSIPMFGVIVFILFSVSLLFSQQEGQDEATAPEQADETPVPTDEAPTATDNVPPATVEEVDAAKRQETQESTRGLNVGPRGAEKIENQLIEDFEDADLWYGGMFIDDGVIQVQKIRGGDQTLRNVDPDGSKFVLGAKVNFLRRSYSEASVEPPRSIRIPGFSRKISVWVAGRNAGHDLYAIVRDMKNRIFRIYLGNLRYSGWRKLEALIPEDSFILQDDPRAATYYHRRGLMFEGFQLEFAPFETIGTYYVYFDNLRFESNVYEEEEELRRANTPIELRNDPIDDW